MTYSSESKNKKLDVKLSECKMDKWKKLEDVDDIPSDFFKYILLVSPTSESKYSKSLENYGINKRNTNEFLKKLFKDLELTHVYFYSVMVEKKSNEKEDLKETFFNESNSCLYCYVGSDSLVKSVYNGLRNALAHGNILRDKLCYLFYSSSSDEHDEDKNIKFYLKIKNISLLSAFKTTLESYKK